MKKKIILLSLLLLGVTLSVNSQNIRNKFYKGKTPHLPKIALPKEINSYSTMVKLDNKGISKDIYTNEEFSDYLQLSNLTYDPNYGKLVIGISPKIKNISFRTVDNKIYVTGEMSVLVPIISGDKLITKKEFLNKTVRNTKSGTLEKQQSEFEYNTSQKGFESFVYTINGKRELTPEFLTTVQRDMLKKHLPEIKKYVLDNLLLGMKAGDKNTFYYIKKGEGEAIETYNENIDAVVRKLENLQTLEESKKLATNSKSELENFDNIANSLDINDKKQRKVIWTALVNQAIIYATSLDFEKAEDILFKAKELNVRKGDFNYLINKLSEDKKRQQRIFDSQGNYRNDIVLKYMASYNGGEIESNKDIASDYNINEAGYVVDSKGKKKEGTIIAEFSKKEKNESNIDENTETATTMLGMGKTNYRIKLVYNKKGKEKTEKYNVKDEISFCIKKGKECYDGFKAKGGSALAVMPMMGSDNKKFFKALHKNDVLGVYDDISDANPHYIVRFLKDDEGTKLKGNLAKIDFSKKMAKFYKKCKPLKSDIEGGKYENTLEDHIKMADIFASCK